MAHNATIAYNLIDDVDGRTVFIEEDLQPGKQYHYTVSLLDDSDVNTTGMFITMDEGIRTLFITTSTFIFFTDVITTTVLQCTSTTTDTCICTYCAMMPSNEPVDTLLVAGVSVAVTAIITSIITAIVSTTIMYLCCVKRTSSVPPVYETPITTTVDVQSNVAYGHVSGGKIPSTAVYDTVTTDL